MALFKISGYTTVYSQKQGFCTGGSQRPTVYKIIICYLHFSYPITLLGFERLKGIKIGKAVPTTSQQRGRVVKAPD